MSEMSTQTDDATPLTKSEVPLLESKRLPDIEWTSLEEAKQKVWSDIKDAEKNRSFVFHLNLSYQQLQSVPKEIGCLNKVISCNLSGNDLENSSFPEEFFEMRFLRVDLQKLAKCNGDSQFPWSRHSNFDLVWGCSRLEELDLSYNHLTGLPPCLCMFIDLRKLNITGNKFEDPSYQASLVKKLFPDCEVLY